MIIIIIIKKFYISALHGKLLRRCGLQINFFTGAGGKYPVELQGNRRCGKSGGLGRRR